MMKRHYRSTAVARRGGQPVLAAADGEQGRWRQLVVLA